jgi:hypothetical protein
MVAEYPDFFHAKPIGKSLEGRTIWSIRISDDKTANAKEPSVLFNALHHAREVMTVEVIMDIADWILTNHETDPMAKEWISKLQIYLIPMVNPDGSNKVWNGSSMWRKNVRGGHGVDINRNYPYKWNACGGSSGSTFAQDYRGPSAASEPETQVMVSFVKSIRPSFNISFHSYGEMVLYPFGCKNQRTPVDLGVERMGKEMAKLIDYRPGTSWDILYDVDGGDIDWMFGEAGVIPFVIEVSPKDDGFQPSFETRDPLVAKMRSAWKYLLSQFTKRGVQITTSSDSGIITIEKVLEGKLTLVYTGPSMVAPKFFPLEMGEYQVTFQMKNFKGEALSVVERVKLIDNLPRMINLKGKIL